MSEDVSEGVGDDSLLLGYGPDALHGEGLPGAGLAVGEDGAVVALQHVLHYRTRYLVVYVKLPAYSEG